MEGLILEIMSKAININNDPENSAQISFEFYPNTKVLRISIYINGKQSKGLTKSWSVDTTDEESLRIVKKDLQEIELPKNEISETDLLGD